MRILVTVGTTKFDDLIDCVLENSHLFKDHILTMQIGSYSGDISRLPATATFFEYTLNMADYYATTDYVITHGGSGTILNALNLNIPILVIPNTKLLHNHQLEVVEKLKSLQLIHTCTLKDFRLIDTPLKTRPPKSSSFVSFVNALTNF